MTRAGDDARRPARDRRPSASASGLPRSWSSAQRRTLSCASASRPPPATTAKRCSSSGTGCRGRAEFVADHRPVLGQDLDEDARVARDAERLRRPGARAGASTAPRSRRPRRRRRSARPTRAGGRAASARICASVSSVSVKPSCESEPQPAEDAQRVLAEAVRPDRVQSSRRSRCATAAERIDELARLQPSRHGVDGEVAPRHVVHDRHGRVGDDLEVAVPRADALLAARWRQLEPGRRERPDRRVARVEADADELAVHLEVLHPPVRLERRAQAGVVDARHEEVLVARGRCRAARRARRPRRCTRRDRASGRSGGSRSARAGEAARVSRLQVGDGLDLDAGAGGKRGHLERRASRRLICRHGSRRPRSSPGSPRGRAGRRWSSRACPSSSRRLRGSRRGWRAPAPSASQRRPRSPCPPARGRAARRRRRARRRRSPGCRARPGTVRVRPRCGSRACPSECPLSSVAAAGSPARARRRAP